MEFAAPENEEVVSVRKSVEVVSAAKNVGKQTLREHSAGGSRQRTVIPTKVTEQVCPSHWDIFTNISR